MTLWRSSVIVLLALAATGLWLRPPVRVEHVDCIETWKRLEGLETVAQRKLVDAMLVEAAKLRAWEQPMVVMKQIRLRPLQDAVAEAEARRHAVRQSQAETLAQADAEIARRRQAVSQEEQATYSRVEALAFLRERGIPTRTLEPQEEKR